MELPKKILDEIWEYCRLNKITDVDGFINKMVKQGFTVEKYGATPSERIVEKEVEKEVEVIKEVPVEVIKEVEKIVEKEVYITDDEASKKLTDKIVKLEEYLEVEKGRSHGLGIRLSDNTKLSGDRGREIIKLTKEIEELKLALEAEKAKPKQEDKKDIYGEPKKGFLGSNISDLWNKKK